MMAAYKVRNSDGQFARAGFHGWSEKGKTWSARNHLNAALTMWLRDQDTPNWSRRRRGEVVPSPQIPLDWVVVELTENGKREILAREFYAEKRQAK